VLGMSGRRVGTIADVLMSIVSCTSEQRQEELRKQAVFFRDPENILHRLFDFDRGRGAWVAACGLPYEGNGYVETSTPGDSSCIACIAEFDVDR